MRALLLLFLFALVACDFEQKVFKYASCAFKSEKLRENIPKVIEALKAGDFSKILSIGLTSFPEVKKEILDCVNDEPVLGLNCKNAFSFAACSRGCPYNVRNQCMQNCYKKYC